MHFLTVYACSFFMHFIASKLILNYNGIMEVRHMYITNKLVDFLTTSKKLSNSTILLTDLKRVILSLSDFTKEFMNKELSQNLIDILNLYKEDLAFADHMNISMNTIVPLIFDDDISEYKSQIILPIVHSGVVDGLLIFISNDRIYLKSNLKFAKTTQHFVELFSSKKYL